MTAANPAVRWLYCFAATAVCIVLAACDDPDAQRAKDQAKTKADYSAETALMVDLARAGPELERRLTESVSAEDGLVLVKKYQFWLSILPVTAPWTLQCGIAGMSIVFGNSITGDQSEVSNDVTINLSQGQIDQKNCAVLGPLIGKRLLSILSKGQPTRAQ